MKKFKIGDKVHIFGYDDIKGEITHIIKGPNPFALVFLGYGDNTGGWIRDKRIYVSTVCCALSNLSKVEND